MQSPIKSLIEAHTQIIQSGKFNPPKSCCPKCSEQPESYKLHERKVRNLYYIVCDVVYSIFTLLARWKCPVCHKTFTEYPPFIIPHKRYILIDILRLTSDYLENDKQTYRGTTNFNNIPIHHEDRFEVPDEPDDCYISPSTPFRWIGFLGSLKELIENALNLIKQKNPDNLIYREIFPVSPRKYRSSKRKTILENARRLLNIDKIYKSIFNESIFLYLGTRGP